MNQGKKLLLFHHHHLNIYYRKKMLTLLFRYFNLCLRFRFGNSASDFALRNMSTQKHTEKPWSLDDNGFIRLSEQLDECREDIGTENEWVPIVTLDGVVALTHPANAPIIAAAPDLLAALKLAATTKEPDDKIERMIWMGRQQIILAAIAKAEGKK